MSKFRVSEIFGPTIQGEGRHAGMPCAFIRFAGCDYRCSWCDSLHSVLPEFVSKTPQLTVDEIIDQVTRVAPSVKWVVYSGGNPGLFDLGYLTTQLQSMRYSIMAETQGTIWKDWMAQIEDLCVSPKPPSSGNTTTRDVLDEFFGKGINAGLGSQKAYLKVVVFDEEDYAYAQQVRQDWKALDMFLSVGNIFPPSPDGIDNNPAGGEIDAVLKSTRWLMEKVANDPIMRSVRVFPQLHFLAWGNERGR